VSEGDEQPKAFSAREIVEELFPATPTRLVPRPLAYSVRFVEDGGREVRPRGGGDPLRLRPIPSAGAEKTQMCCDLCAWTGPRRDFDTLRSEVPGSHGRRFRYVTACRDADGCEARRLDDAVLDRLLQPVE
jgi:hypothetical protein